MVWKPRIEDSSKPKYVALVDALEADIDAGRLGEGERLPPHRDIASDLGVTIATVTRAFSEAARRGLVSARIGSGTFVRRGEAVGPTETIDRTIDLSLNTVPSGPAKPYLDGVIAEIGDERRSEHLLAYQPAIGTERHRRAVATWFARRLPAPGKSEISLSHGAQHALAACFATFVKPGGTVLCEAWTYTGIRRLALVAQARLVGVPLDREGLEPDALARAFEDTGAKLLICSAAVQNPTAATMSRERREEVVAICRRFDAVIIEDDIYGLLSGDSEPTLSALAPERGVYVSSVSKCTMPGIRLGLISAPTHMSADLRDRLVSLQWTAPSFFAEIVTRLVENGQADACVAAHQQEMTLRLDVVARNWPECERPTLPSYHLWLATQPGWRLDETVADLLASGIRVSPSSHFRVNDAPSKHDYVRLCLGALEDAAPLKKAIRTIRANWLSNPRLSATIV